MCALIHKKYCWSLLGQHSSSQSSVTDVSPAPQSTGQGYGILSSSAAHSLVLLNCPLPHVTSQGVSTHAVHELGSVKRKINRHDILAQHYLSYHKQEWIFFHNAILYFYIIPDENTDTNLYFNTLCLNLTCVAPKEVAMLQAQSLRR